MELKLGERGVIVYDRKADLTWHVPAYPVNTIVDVTGCGDAFCGGFLASFVQNEDAYTSALYGVISASFNLEQYGVIHNFSIDKQIVIDRFNKFNSKLHKSEQQMN